MALDSKIEPNDLNFEKKSLYGKTDDIVEPGELISADSFVGTLDRQDKEQLENVLSIIRMKKTVVPLLPVTVQYEKQKESGLLF